MNSLVKGSVLAVLVSLAGFSFADDCVAPSEPSIPNGAKSSTEEMIGGQKDVKAYMSVAESYLECLKAQEKMQADTLTEEQKVKMVDLHNKAVEKMETLAANWNKELKAYKAAQAGT